jgi:hypothetical protein
MKKIIFMVIVLIAELFAPSFVQAQGTLYVSNLSQTPTDSRAIGSDSWIAQEFGILATDPNTYILNSIQLLMNPASGNPAGFSVSIYGSLSGEPNNNLGNLVGSDPSTGGVFNYTASGITLSSGNYFVVATAATPIETGAYDWSAANGAGNGNWSINDSYATSTDGSSWTKYPRGDVFQMAIYATAVPEPSELALGALGALLLGFHRWRNSSR